MDECIELTKLAVSAILIRTIFLRYLLKKLGEGNVPKKSEDVNFIGAYEDGCLDVLGEAILDGKNEIPELYRQFLLSTNRSVRLEIEGLLNEAIGISKKIGKTIETYRSTSKRWRRGDKNPFP